MKKKNLKTGKRAPKLKRGKPVRVQRLVRLAMGDCDITALVNCVNALDASSSMKMVRANLEFLWDRYITHPSHYIPGRLLPV